MVVLSSAAPAQEVTVTAEVDRAKITLSETIRYSVKVSGATQGLPSPQFPDFSDFVVLQTLPVSTQIFQSGTTVEVSKVTGVVLKPKSLGTFVIPPTSIVHNGKALQSNSITIEVVKDSGEALPPKLEKLGVISAVTQNAAMNQWLRGRLFILAEARPTEIYIGQPATLTYYLYTDGVQIGSPKFMAPEPQYTDFIKHPIKEPTELKFERKSLDDKLYDVATIHSNALIPTKTGEYTLDPLKMACAALLPPHLRQRQSAPRSFFDDDLFDQFFNDPFFSSPFERNTITAVMASQPVTISVKDLPQPAPADFSGTVGNYTLHATVDRTSGREDELITLKLKFTGTGFVDSISEPAVKELPDFEVYSSKSKSENQVLGSVLGGDKEFEYVLRPTRSGTFSIPAIDYTFFNPDIGEYQTCTTNPITLDIAAVKKEQPRVIASAPADADAGASSEKGESVVSIGKDINYIHTGATRALRPAGYIFTSPMLLWFQLIPALAVVAAFFLNRRQERLAADRGLARRLYARGVAARRLRYVKNLLEPGNADEFFAEISNALRGFIADKINHAAAGLTVDKALEHLCLHNVPEHECTRIKEILEQCDNARYAPVKPGLDEMQEVYQQSARIINSLEKHLR